MNNSTDTAARKRIVEDLDTTFLVEAGAGSGKTTKLVDRITALLLQGRADIHQIAAVTFTRKAAAELRERLQQRLEQEAVAADSPAAREKMRTSLADIGQAFIGTIHSFCARMLRERPVESRLDPDFKEMEDAEAALFQETSWQDFVSEAFLRNDETLKKLYEFGIEAKELKDLYLRLCQFRDVEAFVKEREKPDLAYAQKELQKFLNAVRKAMPPEQPEGGWDGLQKAFRRAQWRTVTRDKDLINILELFQNCKVTLNRWPDSTTARKIRDEIYPEFAEVARRTLREWREYIHPCCIAFARAAAEFAAARRSSESRLDFTDLLIKTRDLLRDHEDVRLFLAKRFARILVDEFQDTDPLQCEILFYLAGDRPAPGAQWRSFKLRPGALFVVGDPKQSIYRFRRADISAYNIVKELVQKSGGEVLTLSANYRSVNSIGSFVDSTFKPVFPAKATEHQAGFVPLATVKQDAPGLCGIRKLVVDGAVNKNQIYQRSSELVASWVRWVLKGNLQIHEDKGGLRPVRPDDILILTWQRDALLPHAVALEEREVPFEITGAKGTFDTPQILDVLKLFNTLADPDNQVSLTGLLISSLFGHSYQQLWDYKKLGGSLRFLGAGKSDGAAAAHQVGQSLSKIESWWRLTLDRSPAAAIGTIIERTGMAPLAASSPLGATNAGRLLQLVEMARQAERSGKADFASVVEWLNSAVEADIEPLSLLSGGRGLVRLMNLHKAKGLEAPVVILAAPYIWQRDTVTWHIDRFGKSGPSGYFPATRENGPHKKEIVAQPPLWDEKVEEEKKYLEAEAQRLLYVAGTRAKQLLIVTDAPEARSGNAWAGLLKENVPGLSIKGVNMSVKERRKSKINGAALAPDMQKLADELQMLAKESYAKRSATEIAKPAGELPKSESGAGRLYGSVVHKCLEWMAAGRNPETRDIERICTEFELSPKPVEAIAAELQKVSRSELWQRAMKASERHAEMPFSVFLEGNVLVSGVIDLAFKENGRWHLVDFKTDRIAGNAKAHVDFYSGQLQLYSKAWKKLTGTDVAEAVLFFTDSCTAYPVPPA